MPNFSLFISGKAVQNYWIRSRIDGGTVV